MTNRGIWFPLVAIGAAFVVREIVLGDEAERWVEFVVWAAILVGLVVVAVATGFLEPTWTWSRSEPGRRRG